MSQTAGAPDRAQQKAAPPHQPGQEAFKSILPDDIDWKPPLRLPVLASVTSRSVRPPSEKRWPIAREPRWHDATGHAAAASRIRAQ